MSAPFSYVALYDQRGVLRGHAKTAPWPKPFSADTAPALFVNGQLYLRTEDWEEHNAIRYRVYSAAPTAEPFGASI